MKKLLLIFVLLLGFGAPVSAQEFSGFPLYNAENTSGIQEARISCNSQAGKWSWSPQSEARQRAFAGKVASYGVCLFLSDQNLNKKDVFYKPEAAVFAFDEKKHVVFATFHYTFETWTQRDHAKMLAIKRLHDWFPMTTSRIKTTKPEQNNGLRDVFKLNNTEFYLEMHAKNLGLPEWELMFLFIKNRTLLWGK